MSMKGCCLGISETPLTKVIDSAKDTYESEEVQEQIGKAKRKAKIRRESSGDKLSPVENVG